MVAGVLQSKGQAMGEALQVLQKVFVDGIKDNAFYRCLTYGILFSLILTVAVGWIAGTWHIDGSSPFLHRDQMGGSAPLLIAVMFISFSFLLGFFGYLNDLKAREDIISPLREKLKGVWQVRLQTWRLDQSPPRLDYIRQVCTIGIESVGRKLYLHFKISESELFRDTEFDVVNVHIQYQTEPKQLMYFHETELRLREPIVGPGGTIEKVTIPIVVVVDFYVRDEKVTEMSGKWYDIDNMIYFLSTHVPATQNAEELKKALNYGATTFKGLVEFEKVEFH
jgi:hypothetical protein